MTLPRQRFYAVRNKPDDRREAAPRADKAILIVDDCAALRATYAYLFGKAGWTVHLAVDGAQALRALKHIRVDALVLDLFMPTMDGIEVLISIRPTRPDLAIIFVSGASWSWDHLLDAAMKLGADAALSKTAPIADLMAAVDRSVQARLTH